MSEVANQVVHRRTLLIGTMSAAMVSFLWSCAERGERPTLSSQQMTLLSKVSDLVVPRTDTPGAVDVGVPAFVALALAHGLGGTGDPKSPGAPAGNDYAAWMQENIGPNPAATLPAIDAAAYTKGAAPSPWKAIKGLIMTGYFSSEAGATRALRYELTPGRFDPDIPLQAGETSWASDWTAVDFG